MSLSQQMLVTKAGRLYGEKTCCTLEAPIKCHLFIEDIKNQTAGQEQGRYMRHRAVHRIRRYTSPEASMTPVEPQHLCFRDSDTLIKWLTQPAALGQRIAHVSDPLLV